MHRPEKVLVFGNNFGIDGVKVGRFVVSLFPMKYFIHIIVEGMFAIDLREPDAVGFIIVFMVPIDDMQLFYFPRVVRIGTGQTMRRVLDTVFYSANNIVQYMFHIVKYRRILAHIR